MPDQLAALLHHVIALISITPDPVAFRLGPIPVQWYGVCYAIGLAATYVVVTREARRRGLDARLVDTGIIVVAVAALIGGRLYHVIDQWERYKDDLLTILLPIQRTADGGYQFAGFTGLGVYGGILTGTIAAWILIRLWKQSFWRWADVIAPGLFVMQAIGRWGNFFNQELYGPPTDLPWGITIDCAHRVVQYPCTVYPEATTGFQPLFLYESVSGILGAITLLWIPTAMVMSAIAIALALAVLLWRHRPSAAGGDRWGEPPEQIDDSDVVEEIEVDDEPAGDLEDQAGATEDDDVEIVDDDEPGPDRPGAGGG
jgi:phosphatidylglycerol:prolipoprotein diacylglycerol transferase